jgi:hypothetical protein
MYFTLRIKYYGIIILKHMSKRTFSFWEYQKPVDPKKGGETLGFVLLSS